ncbi:hypothetical protein [Nitrosomonas sp.]|uniref:hypothetical protein n=1 Tax=Nitrosomonas sp. TaxID=42353 RepID=UPI0025D6914C|nr:hypothetical protein [Nitrosomonas sp.]MBV6446657.1 hypothetical protein [Nitrosomonas sp.]
MFILGMNRNDRVKITNEFIVTIAKCGRRFFSHNGNISFFELDHRQRVWFVDSYSKKKIYTHYSHEWKGFTQGGTLKTLIQHIRDYIMAGETKNLNIGPWPSWISNGDLWGYGQDMQQVRDAAYRLGLTQDIKNHGISK